MPKEDLNCPELVAAYFRSLEKLTNGASREPDPAEVKARAEAAELAAYMDSIVKPTSEDVEYAMQLVCSGAEKSKNGIKRNTTIPSLNISRISLLNLCFFFK